MKLSEVGPIKPGPLTDNLPLLKDALDKAARFNETLVLPRNLYIECKPIDSKNPNTIPYGMKGRVHITGETPDSVLEIGPSIYPYDPIEVTELLRIDARSDFDVKLSGFTIQTPKFTDTVDPDTPPNLYALSVSSNYGIGRKGSITIKDMKFKGDACVLSMPSWENDADDELSVLISDSDLESYTTPIYGRGRTGRKRRIWVENNDLRVRQGAFHYGTYITQDWAFLYSNNRVYGCRRAGIKVANSHSRTKTYSKPEFAIIEGTSFIDCKGATAFVVDEYNLTTIRGHDIPSEMGAFAEVYGQANIVDNVIHCPWGISSTGTMPQPNTQCLIARNWFTNVDKLPDGRAGLVLSGGWGLDTFTWILRDNIINAPNYQAYLLSFGTKDKIIWEKSNKVIGPANIYSGPGKVEEA